MTFDPTKYSYAVFSGSSLNLFEHCGATKAAIQSGIVPIGWAGVSGGAMIATMGAAGFTPDEMEELLLSFCPVAIKLLDPEIAFPSMPWSKDKKPTALGKATPWWWPFKSHGAIKGKKLEAVLAKHLKAKGIVKFKDFKVPLKIFTTDVTQGCQMEWSPEATPEALVAPVVVASCRIPGLFQRAILQGHEHVDGGVWANFPVDCWNKKADGTDSQGEGTVGFFFGIDGKAADGFGFVPSVINIMMASRMKEDIDDSPKAAVVELPSRDGFDFFMDAKKAKGKIDAGFQAMAKWCASQ
jgi:hypothetical protein